MVELFPSEGFSSCPPADELLQQINGRSTPEEQLVVRISEHVSYWDSLGWNDPFSSEFYSTRQSECSQHFGLGSVYTPQMVVDGREQWAGSDHRALAAASQSLRTSSLRLCEKPAFLQHRTLIDEWTTWRLYVHVEGRTLP